MANYLKIKMMQQLPINKKVIKIFNLLILISKNNYEF